MREGVTAGRVVLQVWRTREGRMGGTDGIWKEIEIRSHMLILCSGLFFRGQGRTLQEPQDDPSHAGVLHHGTVTIHAVEYCSTVRFPILEKWIVVALCKSTTTQRYGFIHIRFFSYDLEERINSTIELNWRHRIMMITSVLLHRNRANARLILQAIFCKGIFLMLWAAA